MLFKNFTVFQLENFELIFHRLFTDELDANLYLATSPPADLETLPELTSITGFRAPSQIDIQMACDPASPRTDRLYLLNHIRREKKFDAEGIRDKCIRELSTTHPEMSFDEVEQECIRRFNEAKAIAPIKDTKTPLYLRSDGQVIVGAGLNVAKDVVRDVIRAFGTDEDPVIRVTVKGDPSRFNNRHFYTRCENLLDRDVFGLDDDGDFAPSVEWIAFAGHFSVKLPNKAGMTIKNIDSLPPSFRSSMYHAEYQEITLQVIAPDGIFPIDYTVKLTSKGEFKGLTVNTDEIDMDQSYRFWFNQMMALRNTVVNAMGAPEPEQDPFPELSSTHVEEA